MFYLNFLIFVKERFLSRQSFIKIPPDSLKKVPKTKLVIALSLIKILMEGPLVSLSGSPTVSPQTAAL
jgi:hypothetical protein